MTTTGGDRGLFDVVAVGHDDVRRLAGAVRQLAGPSLQNRLTALTVVRAQWHSMRTGTGPGIGTGTVLDGWAVGEIDYAVAFLSAANLTTSRDQGPQPVVATLGAVLEGYARLTDQTVGDRAELALAKHRSSLRELLFMDASGNLRGHLELAHAIIVGRQTAGRPLREGVRTAGCVAVALDRLLSHVDEDPLRRPIEWALSELLPHASALLGDYEQLTTGSGSRPRSRGPSLLLARTSPFAVDEAAGATVRLTGRDLQSLQMAVRYLRTTFVSSCAEPAPPTAAAVAEAARGVLASAWAERAGTADTTQARHLLEAAHCRASVLSLRRGPEGGSPTRR